MKNLNYGLAFPAIALVLVLLTVSALYPATSQAMAAQAMGWVSHWFGWLVQMASLALVVFLLWLACSKYGRIRLGEEKTEYSNFSYGGGIFYPGGGPSFSGGVGEPMYSYNHRRYLLSLIVILLRHGPLLTLFFIGALQAGRFTAFQRFRLLMHFMYKKNAR